MLSIGRGGRSLPDVVWNPDHGRLDAAPLAGVDAVINLAGANLAQRWTARAKEEILDSRVRSTTLLAETVATLDPRPAVFVSMSAVGYYGDTGDRQVDESSPRGSGFLSEVAERWEGAAEPARTAGIRVVHPRMGVILSPRGGALAKMLLPFTFGVGGKIGSGRQWMSWIALADAVRAIGFVVQDPMLGGAVNVTSPAPVTNAVFTRALARALHRPAVATIPAVAISLLYGQMGRDTVVAGQRVIPARLTGAGFVFEHPEIDDALTSELARQ